MRMAATHSATSGVRGGTQHYVLIRFQVGCNQFGMLQTVLVVKLIVKFVSMTVKPP
jgi:hypothetical protein